jgi:hypothetical protein
MTGGHVVGDRLVPSPIEVDFPSADGQPSLYLIIEVLDGVPRCTEITFKRSGGGREVRDKDLRAIPKDQGLDSWIEAFVAICSGEIVNSEPGEIAAIFGGEESVRAGMRTIRDVRKGSRRPLTDERKQRVAQVYNANDVGGIEAVERAFTVSRSTAIRYIKAAREAGLIEKRDQ